MSDFFKDIFDYHHHFNQQLAARILEHPGRTTEAIQKLFSHVLNAHQVWNSRILGQPSFQVWQINDPELYKAIDDQNYADTLRVLREKDLSATVSYTNSRGDTFSNTVKDILFHINNHSTYHKGQLALQFKAIGIAPLVTDYIFFRR